MSAGRYLNISIRTRWPRPQDRSRLNFRRPSGVDANRRRRQGHVLTSTRSPKPSEAAMMMVPRSFVGTPIASRTSRGYEEKENYVKRTRPKDIPRRYRPASLSENSPRSQSSSSLNSEPATSPSRSPATTARAPLQPSKAATTTHSINSATSIPRSIQQPLRRRQSAQDVLAATAIPIRRKPKQRLRQRLPDGDHVTDFSRLLMDDLRSGDRSSMSSSLGNPQFDGLFGNIDELVEGEMIVGSGGLDSGILTTRSISTESVASLASPDDFSSVDNNESSTSLPRWNSDRRVPQLAKSESCEEAHPLSEKEDFDASPTISPPQRRLARERKANTFKSSLTASLKAIKSAAQSVSNYATSTPIQPDDFLSRSIFDIQPSMTDDRRPPPSDEPPSPALRRYLNPDYSHQSESPAQLHFWLDHRQSFGPSPDTASSLASGKLKVKKRSAKGVLSRPQVVPLATCIPPVVKTAHASSPPIWLAPDGTPSNSRTAVHNTASASEAGAAFGGLKQREPRENRDFLRVFVAEMEMKRHGKLREDAEGRARMWLPPIVDKPGKQTSTDSRVGGTAGVGVEARAPPQRWESWSFENV